MMRLTSLFLLAAAVVGLLAVDSHACCRGGGYYCCPPCWYPCCPFPCEPCCPPDTTPLDPLPLHPQPVTNGTTLFLENWTYSEAFAIIYLRHPDGIYRIYRKYFIAAGTAPKVKGPYYQGDHLLIETWSRGTQNDRWHCRCRHLVELVGLESTFDVIRCHYHAGPPHKQEASAGARPAAIVVSLPADATLIFDDRATSSTSATRVFTTPDLTPGVEFSYTLKAELNRGGEIQVVSQKVVVRAGEETRVNVEFATAALAAK